MSLTVRIPSLIQRLKNVEDEAEQFTDPFRDLENHSGVRYLYQSVLLPLLKDQPVETCDLDMDCFDIEDIGALFSFYVDNFTRNSGEFSRLRRIYEKCSESPAKPTPVRFL